MTNRTHSTNSLVLTNAQYAAKDAAKPTASLAKAQDRLAQEKSAKLMAKLDLEVAKGHLTVQEALTLGMVYSHSVAKPDGRFAEVLVSMLQGEF